MAAPFIPELFPSGFSPSFVLSNPPVGGPGGNSAIGAGVVVVIATVSDTGHAATVLFAVADAAIGAPVADLDNVALKSLHAGEACGAILAAIIPIASLVAIVSVASLAAIVSVASLAAIVSVAFLVAIVSVITTWIGRSVVAQACIVVVVRRVAQVG